MSTYRGFSKNDRVNALIVQQEDIKDKVWGINKEIWTDLGIPGSEPVSPTYSVFLAQLEHVNYCLDAAYQALCRITVPEELNRDKHG